MIRFVLALETGLAMRAVTERLVARCAASAKTEYFVGNLDLGAVCLLQLDLALYQQRAVFPKSYCYFVSHDSLHLFWRVENARYLIAMMLRVQSAIQSFCQYRDDFCVISQNSEIGSLKYLSATTVVYGDYGARFLDAYRMVKRASQGHRDV